MSLKLEDLTLKLYLNVLQERGHADVAHKLYEAVSTYLVPFWKLEALNEMLYVDVLKMFKGIIALKNVKPGGHTVQSRIAQLRSEGFQVFEKPRET